METHDTQTSTYIRRETEGVRLYNYAGGRCVHLHLQHFCTCNIRIVFAKLQPLVLIPNRKNTALAIRSLKQSTRSISNSLQTQKHPNVVLHPTRRTKEAHTSHHTLTRRSVFVCVQCTNSNAHADVSVCILKEPITSFRST